MRIAFSASIDALAHCLAPLRMCTMAYGLWNTTHFGIATDCNYGRISKNRVKEQIVCLEGYLLIVCALTEWRMKVKGLWEALKLWRTWISGASRMAVKASYASGQQSGCATGAGLDSSPGPSLHRKEGMVQTDNVCTRFRKIFSKITASFLKLSACNKHMHYASSKSLFEQLAGQWK